MNDKEIGIFGHEKVLNFHAGITAEVDEDGEWLFVKPSAVCLEDSKKYLIEWPFTYLKLDDQIQIIPTTKNNINEHERKYEMRGK